MPATDSRNSDTARATANDLHYLAHGLLETPCLFSGPLPTACIACGGAFGRLPFRYCDRCWGIRLKNATLAAPSIPVVNAQSGYDGETGG